MEIGFQACPSLYGGEFMGNSVFASALTVPSIHIDQLFWFVHSRFIIEVFIGHHSHLKKLFGSETKENPCKATKAYDNDAGSALFWGLILLKWRINFTMLFTSLNRFGIILYSSAGKKMG
jgi:hypothetical protein